MKSIKYEMMIIICVVFTIVAIVFGTRVHNNAIWNDGKCSCGGSWCYLEPVGHAYSTQYLYECDHCGKMHEFYEKR